MNVGRLSLGALDPAVHDVAEALTRAARLVSPRVGVVAGVRFMETTAEEPAVFWAQSRAAALGPLAGRPAFNDGNGTSVDPDRAAMKAIGESVERYCSAFYDERQVTFGAYDDLACRSARPEDFALFSSTQYARPDFPFAPFTRTTRVGWVPGHSLLADAPTWVPASSVYVPYDHLEGEPVLSDQISTGLACGLTYANATLKGLTEAVERDAYTIVWQNRLPRPHVDLDAIEDPFIQRFVNALKRLAISTHAVLLTLDIPLPVILVLMTRDDGPPWTVVASGADPSPRRALGLALEEACLALIGMGRSVAVAGDFQPDTDFSNVTTLMRHGLSHALDARLRPSVEFLATPSEVVALHDLPDAATGMPLADLRTVLRGMRPLVSDVIAVDVTTPDVDEAGFKVVRVVVPDLQRMDMDHRFPHLGGHRLYDVPLSLGLVASRPTERDLNPAPHPFP